MVAEQRRRELGRVLEPLPLPSRRARRRVVLRAARSDPRLQRRLRAALRPRAALHLLREHGAGRGAPASARPAALWLLEEWVHVRARTVRHHRLSGGSLSMQATVWNPTR